MTPPKPKIHLPITPERFKQNYREISTLGSGADGRVALYTHRAPNSTHPSLAVKTPISGHTSARLNLVYEIKALVDIGPCATIVGLLGFDEYHLPHGPAIFYEYCDLGAAHEWRATLAGMNKAAGGGAGVPEESVWKMLSDLAQGLAWMHSREVPYGHFDLKSDNVMVCSNPSSSFLPTFKLGDFSRAKKFTAETQPDIEYNGGFEFGPPHEQRRKGCVTLALDVWNLGSVVQWFCLNMFPSSDIESFLERHPELGPERWTEGAVDEIKRTLLPPAVRPLNLSREAQEVSFGVARSRTVRPFSGKLNRWYLLCHEEEVGKRVSAGRLVEFLGPVAESEIRVLSARRGVDETERKLERLRRDARALKGGETVGRQPPTVPPRPDRRAML